MMRDHKANWKDHQSLTKLLVTWDLSQSPYALLAWFSQRLPQFKVAVVSSANHELKPQALYSAQLAYTKSQATFTHSRQ